LNTHLEAGTPDNRVHTVTLEQIDLDRHAGLLADWRSRPHVTEWWLQPEFPLDGVTGESHEHALIAVDGLPVGYLRWRPVDRISLDEFGFHDVPEGSIDIDIFIGEPKHTGQGTGPAALRMLLERLKADTAAPLAGLCTSVQNLRAIDAFEKAGFRKFREYDDPRHGRCWLLVAEVSAPRRM
jgi:aminoglycoside 6'-N-acetyltransferase